MKNIYVLLVVLLVLGGLGVLTILSAPTSTEKNSFPDIGEGTKGVPYQEFVNPSGYVNTNGKAIKLADYIGEKVVLLDIMTYSCINCQRTFPYLKAWYEMYEDDGLIVIGIHTPEFAFEKNQANVEDAMQRFGLNFPVILDNDYETWRAYKNNYWPHKYLIDIHGNVVYEHVGEGAYDKTEQKIRELLKEREQVLGIEVGLDDSLVSEMVPEIKTNARSPETYFGSFRNELLMNGVAKKAGKQSFSLPSALSLNKLYLNGEWNIEGEFAEAVLNSEVHYKYSAKEVYIVAEAENGGTITVLQDGQVVGTSAGADVENGMVEVGKSRLYKLINNDKGAEHLLELRVSPGVKLFAFTFG